MRRQFRWDKKYLYWGITAFCVIACAILFYMALRFLPDLRRALSSLGRILSPFIWGFVITYLIAPLMKLLEKKVFGPFCRRLFRKNKKRDGSRLARGLSVAVAELVLVAVLTGLVALILPKLIENIGKISGNWEQYSDAVIQFVNDFQATHPQISEAVVQNVSTVVGDIESWVERLPSLTEYLKSFMSSAYGVLRGIYNLIIGIVVSVYVLSDLERFTAAVRRWVYSVFTLDFAEKLRDAVRFMDRTFMGFISGKLLDSAIIALLCYIGCSILGIPEALLVSAIVGVTNIIPFFGPIIGAVPSAFIILMEGPPIKSLVFVIFVIFLQQLDGNVIGPKILGNSIGITGFWVLFAIVVGAGLFGFGGMLLGVPVFVVIYTFLNSRVEKRLKRNDLPPETEDYVDLDYIDPVTRSSVKKTQPQPENGAEKTPTGET